MNLGKRISIGLLVGGFTWLGVAGNIIAEGTAQSATSQGWVAKGDWQRRVVQRGPTAHSGPEQARADQKRIPQWTPSRQEPVRTASRVVHTNQEAEVIPPGQQEANLVPQPADDAYEPFDVTGGPEVYGTGAGFGDCGPGGDCDDGYGGPGVEYEGYPGECDLGLGRLRTRWWARDLSLFAGVQGFKGPFDQGRNGNFGSHEGVNFGAPLGGPWGAGYQVGFAALQSNFSGDRTTGQVTRADRDQFFFTTGIFRRALTGGLQWGVTLDLLRDLYYAKADMEQIRAELGYVFEGGQREIGFMGSFGVDDDEVLIGQSTVSLEPTDLFAFYYRRYFGSGGEGRFWGGWTGSGDGLLGADFRIALGRSWALENRISYLIPGEGRGTFGQSEESWSLGIRLVWHMGQTARCAQTSAYRPLLDVADNSLFMFDVRNR